MSKMSIYEGTGLISQVDSIVTNNMRSQLPSKIEANSSRYAQKWHDCYKKTFSEIDWELEFENEPIIPLDPQIEESIRFLFDRMETYNLGSEWLDQLIQTHLLVSYHLWHTEEASEHTNIKLILPYYEFLRTEVQRRNKPLPELFNEHPITKYLRLSKQQRKILAQRQAKEREISERLCPNCSARGRDIISWSSLRYRCKICGKTFKKPIV